MECEPTEPITEAERDRREYARDMLRLFVQREREGENYVFKPKGR